MIRWSLKTLFAEPLRLLVAATGVASAFMLVIFFQGVFEGESEQIVAYPRHADADVWVMQEGVSNMHMASSLLWDWKADRIAGLPGVSEVTAFLYMNTVLYAGGRQWFAYVVGLAPGAPRGGPWSMTAGRPDPGPGEAVIPDVIASLTGIDVGDVIQIASEPFHVVGLSHGTFSMANSIIFVTRRDLARIMDARGSVSYIIVKAEPGIAPRLLADRIKTEIEKVNALPQTVFIENDRKMAMQMGTEIIRIMTVIGMLLAILIVAFTAHTHVVRKQRELAIAKALGFNSRQIYTGAVLQTVIICLLGYLIAVATAYSFVPLVPRIAPQISVAVSYGALFVVAVLAFVVAVLASLWPARRIVVVDPLSVFRK